MLLPFIVGSAEMRDPGHEVVPRAYLLPCGCEAYFILPETLFSTSSCFVLRIPYLERKFICYVAFESANSMLALLITLQNWNNGGAMHKVTRRARIGLPCCNPL